MNCSDLNMPPCTDSKDSLIKLKTPELCTAKHTNTLQDLSVNYSGTYLNRSQLTMPSNLIHHAYTKGLADLSKAIPVPDTLDWRKLGGDKIENGSRNQGQCGCCWAMASTSVLGDRYALKYNKKAPYPSVAWTTMCLNSSYPGNQQCACGGNNYVAACNFQTLGTKLEACFPFATTIAKNNYNTPACPTQSGSGDDCCADCCGNPLAKVKFFAAKSGLAYLGFSVDNLKGIDPDVTVRAIQQDIYQHGPVLTSFNVPKDWSNWFSTNRGNPNMVYKPSNADWEGGHSVTLVGWGRDKTDQLYWILRNSWGDNNQQNGGFCNMLASYDPKHQKIQIPKEHWTGLDVPIAMDGSFNGGCVSFLPGDKPDWPEWADSSGPGSLPLSVPGGESKWSHINWIYLIGVVVLIIILLLATKKKRSK